MFRDSWNAYVEYAWGNESLAPVSNSSYQGKFGDNSGLTIVAAMSTLWVMDLKEEFAQGKEWIDTNLDLTKFNRNLNVFEIITHYIGGLLSSYALSNETMFLEHAT